MIGKNSGTGKNLKEPALDLKAALSKTTLLVPALNEEEGIAAVIRKAKALGIGDVLVLDGRSTDRTVEIAKKNGARVIVQEGKGKGAAFQTFLKKALPSSKSDFFVMIDADSSYDASDVPRVVRALLEYDVVSGTRTTIRFNPRDFVHFLGNKFISLLGSALFFRPNVDICTGLWGFKKRALEKMRVRALGFDLEADLFAQACKKNLNASSIDIEYRPRVGRGKLKTSDAVFIIQRLFTERFTK